MSSLSVRIVKSQYREQSVVYKRTFQSKRPKSALVGVSCVIENAVHLGLPVPEKFKTVLS